MRTYGLLPTQFFRATWWGSLRFPLEVIAVAGTKVARQQQTVSPIRRRPEAQKAETPREN
jgi:hypothetical protein